MRRTTILAIASVLSLGMAGSAARADDAPSQSDTVFAFGQMAGSQTACDVPKDKVNALMDKGFSKIGIELKEGSDLYNRFVAGVADGAKQVKDGAATCEDVKAGFEAFSAKLGE